MTHDDWSQIKAANELADLRLALLKLAQAMNLPPGELPGAPADYSFAALFEVVRTSKGGWLDLVDRMIAKVKEPAA